MQHDSNSLDEQKRHNEGVKQLHAAQAEWSKTRTERLGWINEELRRQGHAIKTLHDVDTAIHEYEMVTSNQLNPLGPEPQLSDFYMLSDNQKDPEITFIVLGMATTGLVAFKLA